MMIRTVLLVLSLLAVPVMTSAVHAEEAAQSSSTTQPKAEKKPQKDVDIESDSMEILEKDKKAIFKGSVKLVRGDTTINSDVMVVTYADVKQPDGTNKTEVTFLDGEGNVKIVTKNQTVTGQKMHMDVKKNTLLVTDTVKVVQGKTIMNGQRLFSDLNTNRSEMTGGRVKGSFVPGQ
jgi:lipopolysaccharide export system protein LptA